LGEVDQGKLDKVSGILEDLVKEKEYFYLRIISVGAFPRISSPRVIWVGIDKGDNETKVIAKELEQNLAKIGIPKENRPFSSHITIGRTRSSLNLQNLVEGLNILASVPPKENLEFNVTKIALCKSTLTPKGPIYEILKVVSLKTI
jgi:2'-5' RNA ligase